MKFQEFSELISGYFDFEKWKHWYQHYIYKHLDKRWMNCIPSAFNHKVSENRKHNIIHSWENISIHVLKPQDSFGEFEEKKFLIFRNCRKSSENTIRPSCNCLDWHILMQYCPMANYHYVHNLWQSVRGDSKHSYVLLISWKWKHFGANCYQGINSSYNPIKFCINNNNNLFSFSPCTKTIHWL